MFDPTIFDNWKVVAEGAVYDLDREGEAEVIDRKDLVDLAGLSRSFHIAIRLPEGNCRAELRLHSGLADFAGEWYPLQAGEADPPGIRLEITLTLPGERIRKAAKLEERLQALWEQEDVELAHRAHIGVDPAKPAPTSASYEITVLFRRKWNEDRIGDIHTLKERMLDALHAAEEL